MNKISNKVMKVGEWNNSSPSIMFRVACDCMSPECDLTVDFEIDHDYLTLIFYKKLRFISDDYFENPVIRFLSKIKKKTKAIYNIIFHGYLETEECLILRGEEHINSFISALEEGKNFVIENSRKK